MTRVAVAAVSQDAADAGARVAADGGNAVDVAVATSLAAVVTHPGMCSVGGGAFATVWPPSGAPVTVDGGLEMPGRGLPPERFGDGLVDVELGFAGGVSTAVGPGSVATPGLLAALSRAARRFGDLPWARLVEPAVERARTGFPLPEACHAFLEHAHRPIYARDPRGRTALEDQEGRLLEPGGTVRVPGLAESLRTVAEEGAGAFYRGELGRRIVEHVQEEGGLLTRDDLASYRVRLRDPLEVEAGGWRVCTTPRPSAGGAALAAMTALLDGRAPPDVGTPEGVRRMVRVQEAVLGCQRRRWTRAAGPTSDPEEILAWAADRGVGAGGASPSTLHTSTVDDRGTACSITLSDGYGSGIVPPGTGIWLNNCLGERELNPGGLHALDPGTRLPTSMAPSAARGPGGRCLAVGSPGSRRIPTAVLQVLVRRLLLGAPLDRAVEHPRLHVDPSPERTRVSVEPGVPVEAMEGMDDLEGRRLEVRRFPERSMFFGGVEAAARSGGGAFDLSADSRRTGGVAVGGGG